MMKPFFTSFVPAVVLLGLASGCATTMESQRPTAMRAQRQAPNASNSSVQPTLSLAGATAGTAKSADVLGAPAPEASAATFDPGALSAKEASTARAAERRLSSADYKNQLAQANAALKSSPKNGTALFERARANSNLKNYKEAKADYVAALRTLHGNPDVYYNKAVNELMMHQYVPATKDFSGVLRLRPDDKEAFFGRGVAQMQLFKYKAAVADFTRALVVDSLYADALEYRGISYANFDRTKEAQKDLEKAARLNPEAQKSLRRYGSGSIAQK
jgi:tetratricopeptide (TPR) repeat protein